MRLERRPDPESDPETVELKDAAGLDDSSVEGIICDNSRSCISFSSFLGCTEPLCAKVLQDRTRLFAIHFLTWNVNNSLQLDAWLNKPIHTEHFSKQSCMHPKIYLHIYLVDGDICFLRQFLYSWLVRIRMTFVGFVPLA